jgi:hypothetical protein
LGCPQKLEVERLLERLELDGMVQVREQLRKKEERVQVCFGIDLTKAVLMVSCTQC